MKPEEKWKLQAQLDEVLNDLRLANAGDVAAARRNLEREMDAAKKLLDETTECARCGQRMPLADVACEDSAPFVVVPVCRKCQTPVI